MRFSFIKCQGSGNDFPLIDARAIVLSDAQWAMAARALADRAGPVGGDGLLLLVPGRNGAAFGQRMLNPDGSEAETCLNGLRCVARLGFEATGLRAATASLPTSMAEVALADPIAPSVVSVSTFTRAVSTAIGDVGLALPAGEIIDAIVPGLPSARRFTAVAMPNPHLVTFVDAIDEGELVALGDWCEAAPALVPRRCNVSFVTADARGLYVRTYERGVGLTDSCGSAMGASIHAAALTGRIATGSHVLVRNRGGFVRGAARDGGIVITGNATFERDAMIDVDLERGVCTGPIEQVRERRRERDAWTIARG
ncbi:diaminopimelate epimerase [Sphingomonas baiyangensis]|nr:diaminopimelate epimerase [Sphingomonas baiyangensis]